MMKFRLKFCFWQQGANWIATISGAGALVVAMATGTIAQTRFDPYTVTGVRITWKSAVGGSPAPKIVSLGATQAGAALLRRVTGVGDHRRLPVLTLAKATRLLESHSISETSTVRGKRSALVAYRFSPVRVRGLLAEAGIAVVDRIGPPIVILPVWKAKHGAILWDDPNPLRRAWQRVLIRPGLVPIVVPEGSLKDLQMIDGPTAARGDRAALARIATSYRAGTALRVFAEPDGTLLRLSITSFPANTGLPSGAVWNITIKATTRGYRRSLGQIVDRLRRHWKASISVPAGPSARLALTAQLRSFAHWVALRRTLNALPRIKRLHVRQISSLEAQLVLQYVGSLKELRNILQQKGLTLSRTEGQNGDVVWRLLTRNASADPSLRRSDRPRRAATPKDPDPRDQNRRPAR